MNTDAIHLPTPHTSNADHFLAYLQANCPKLGCKFLMDKLALVFTNDFRTTYSELNDCERNWWSTIVDIVTGEIVSRIPAVDVNNFMDITSIEIQNDYQVTYFTAWEGTRVTLYYHIGKWCCATRKTFDANSTYWKSKNSIGSQFCKAISIFNTLHISRRL